MFRFILILILFFFTVRTIPLNAQSKPANASALSVLEKAQEKINSENLKSHIQFLADDLLEGRGPGSRGDRLAQNYIKAKFRSLGFKPGAKNGSYFQPFPLVGITTQDPPSIRFNNGGQSLELKRDDDFVMVSGKQQKETGFKDAELVFVGYGIVAPEYDWNDFKDADLKGKILVIMNNDPSDDPKLFEGKRRLYYGRWDYKYETAAKQGAAGAFIIHTTPSAGYPYQVVRTSWNGEQFELLDNGQPRTEMNGWVTEEAAHKIAKLSGKDLDELRKAAESRDFKPIPLGTTLSLSLKADIRRKKTANVLAKIEGSDPRVAKETVIFMAHHDHIGLAPQRDVRGDNIYNGAVDNAAGVASLLAIADAVAAMPKPPRRSIMFAAVGAEEQGLLGSKFFAEKPPIHPGTMAAVINMDGANILGPTRDLNVIGLGKSSMDGIVSRFAKMQNRVVVPDQFPDRGYYYRSDQFSLARIGVPGVYLHAGVHVIGKPEGWGKKKLEEWTETDYHQTSDEYKEEWNLDGAAQDVQLLFRVGMETANQRRMPTWTAGDEFEAARKDALLKRKQAERRERQKNGPMAKVVDDPKLPRVLLIGDSISIGYTVGVRNLLKGKANVHRPLTNCGPTTTGLKEIEKWLGDGKWDVIHFNWGLHDLKYMGPNGENLADPKDPSSKPQVPQTDYKSNLEKLVQRLKKTDAKLIWRNTTPVPVGAKGRVVGDSKKYNDIAKEIMESNAVEIHDLYRFALEHADAIQQKANVHYTPAGSQKLAEEVVKVIEAALKK